MSHFGSTNGSGTGPTIPVTSATGELIFDIVGNDSSDPSITPNGAQTSRYTPWGGGNILQAAGSSKAGSASTSMSWTLGGTEAWAQSYGSFQ